MSCSQSNGRMLRVPRRIAPNGIFSMSHTNDRHSYPLPPLWAGKFCENALYRVVQCTGICVLLNAETPWSLHSVSSKKKTLCCFQGRRTICKALASGYIYIKEGKGKKGKVKYKYKTTQRYASQSVSSKKKYNDTVFWQNQKTQK